MNRKKGIILIVISVLIFAVYLISEYVDFGTSQDSSNSSSSPQPIATMAYNITSTADVITVPDDGDVETRLSSDSINISKEILQQLKVSKSTFVREIQIYANSSGYSAADGMETVDEVQINHTNHTITIPCYFRVGKEESYFDVIYQYKSKTWQFRPY